MTSTEGTTTTDYSSKTVVELQDELRSRGLPTSGVKDELIARLQEDDAKLAAGETQEQADAEINAEVDAQQADVVEATEIEDYYPARVYSPWELPANTAAAQLFYDTNPHAVDPALELDPDRQAQANAAIQLHVDEMAAVGVTVEDPRLTGGGGGTDGGGEPPSGPTVTSVEPNTGPAQTVTHIVLTGTGLTNVKGNPSIGGKSCHNTVIVNDTTVNTDTDGNTNAGTHPVIVTMQDNSTITGPDFTYT